jgi:cytochrome c-type biogenesis protein CcmH
MNMIIGFGLMLAVSLAWIIWYLKRPLADNGLDLQHSNIELGKQKKLELQLDLDQGLIDQEQFNQAQEEISTTLAFELESSNTKIVKTTNISVGTWLIIVLLLPVLSIYTYQQLTSFSSVITTAKVNSPPLSLEQSVVKIEQFLKDNPNDIEALKMLGLSYFELNKIDASLKTYEKAYQLDPKNAGLLVEYASTMISANNNQFTDSAVKLIKEALKINPNSVDALYLAGMFAVSVQNFGLAKNLWNKALNSLPESSADRQALISILAELKRKESNQQSHTVTINLVIADEILATRSPEDFLMIYVKPAVGRPMPIAIEKLKIKDFNGQIILSDKNSIMPTKLLSEHNKVLVVARLSRTGGAMKQADDLQVTSNVVNVADNPNVVLKLN